MDDATAWLIAHNRDLLSAAAAAREAAQEAIARAEDTVRSTMEIRVAWALRRAEQRRESDPGGPG